MTDYINEFEQLNQKLESFEGLQTIRKCKTCINGLSICASHDGAVWGEVSDGNEKICKYFWIDAYYSFIKNTVSTNEKYRLSMSPSNDFSIRNNDTESKQY